MSAPLRHRPFRHLFAAQVAALIGTGLATVALGLLAHDLAGASAGEILGAVLAIKMVAYIAVAPFASAIASRLPRKVVLVALDVVRAAVAGALPFVSEAWQVYGLMTVLYVASAGFTPAFQALIPDLLPDEKDYTQALSYSRLASDLESVVSPVLAALLLSFISFNDLFVGTSVGFMTSALLVVTAAIPLAAKIETRSFWQRLTGGVRLFLLTPRLRGILLISVAEAAGGAMVFVNTVVLVQSGFKLSGQATAWALAVFGGGSMITALTLPRMLTRITDRTVMLAGAVVMTVTLSLGAVTAKTYPALLALWAVMGVGYALTLTPVGRVLRRSSNAADRPALFAAQFALSHAAWLIAYPMAGLVSAKANPGAAFMVLAVLCAFGTVLGFLVWPAADPDELPHQHDDLPSEHPHQADSETNHSHPFVLDDLHKHWPKRPRD